MLIEEIEYVELKSGAEEKAAEGLEGLEETYVGTILPKRGPVGRKKGTTWEGFCLTPGTKRKLIGGLKKDIDKGLDDEEITDEEKAVIIKQLHNITEVINRTQSCDVDELDALFDRVKDAYPETGEDLAIFLTRIQNEILDDKLAKSGFGKAAVDRASAKVENWDALAENEQIDLMREEALLMGEDSESQFLRRRYSDTYKALKGFAYDGAKGQKKEGSDNMPSPCGLRIKMAEVGEDGNIRKNDGIVKAMDLLAFLGSKFDWKRFYLDGEEDVEGESFHRMHPDDWPGCFNMFKDEKKESTDERLDELMTELEKDDLDFVEAKRLPGGYWKAPKSE
jgi:hypothetical protein